jgi:hypothetical protein
MPRLTAAAAGCALLLSAAAGARAQSGAGGEVRMATDVQARMGVATAPLTSSRRAGEIDAFAKVLDPGPLVQADSDLRTAEAAAAASRAEAARSKALNASGAGVSDKDREAAVAQASSDALHVTLLRRQLGLVWGPGIERMAPARRDALVRGLADGSIALVHVDTHNNEGQAGARAVRIDVGDGSVNGAVIGPARAAEPRLQSSGLIVEVKGPQSILLSVGLVQSAHIATTTAQAGVLIPRGAVIRFAGSDWAYVRRGPAAFERRLLQDPTPQPDGFFETQGFAAGDAVVVKGAAAMFAAEQGQAGRAD